MVWGCLGLGMNCIVQKWRQGRRGQETKDTCLDAEALRKDGREKQRRGPPEGGPYEKTGRRWWRPVDDYDQEIGLAFFAARSWLFAGAALLFCRG